MKALDVLSYVFGALDKVIQKTEEDAKNNKTEIPEQKPAGELEQILLTDERVSQMRWMGPGQLQMIFGGGKKRKAVFPIDENPWEQLRWFSADQLEAIFGKDGI